MNPLAVALLVFVVFHGPAHGRFAFEPASAPPPWRRPCVVSISAYEDGSATLRCAGSDVPFGRIDAETGRVRILRPDR